MTSSGALLLQSLLIDNQEKKRRSTYSTTAFRRSNEEKNFSVRREAECSVIEAEDKEKGEREAILIVLVPPKGSVLDLVVKNLTETIFFALRNRSNNSGLRASTTIGYLTLGESGREGAASRRRHPLRFAKESCGAVKGSRWGSRLSWSPPTCGRGGELILRCQGARRRPQVEATDALVIPVDSLLPVRACCHAGKSGAFGDEGPTVGKSRYIQLDRRGPSLLLFHRGAVRSEKQGMSSDEQSLTFDSYTIPEDDLELGQLCLLEVDNRVVVPAKSHLHIIVTSADVLHSWVVPSLGVKCDAVPGRLNQISISVQQEGVYYGQCSEIYGTNHAFMRAPRKIVDKIDEGVRLPVEQRIRSCEGGQSKIVLFLYRDNIRSQRLGATLFLSYSSFFMISCRSEQTKQKRGPSQRKEKDLQRQRLLTLFLFLAIFYESENPPQRDPQNRIEKGGQGSRKSLPFFPVKIDGKELYQGHK
ncbi:cytochrome c oxidase subunit 2 [Tanacetum coccineum]